MEFQLSRPQKYKFYFAGKRANLQLRDWLYVCIFLRKTTPEFKLLTASINKRD